jgi:transcriptional antiterminator RfaH
MYMQLANHAEGPGIIPADTFPLGLAFGERWFAINTQPLAEARAQRNLENQGFRTFMPRRRKMLRHARKLTVVEAPLFPRYLFTAFDPCRDQWRKVNSTFGVSHLVMRGEAPHPVPDGVIEALIAVTVDGGIIDLAAKLRAGSPVRVMAGPFAEQLARLEQLDDSGRAHILLEILGRQVRTTTERRNLMPVG